MSRPLAALAAVGLSWASTGCAGIHRDAGFGDVQSSIRQRSGYEAYWGQQPSAEAAVEERVRALLAEDLTESVAVEIALLSNRRLQATFEELGIARADLLEARLVNNPILGAEIRYPDRPLEISITQSIMDLITLRRRRGVAEASFEAAKSRVADEVLRMVAEVRSAFYSMQAAEQMRVMRAMVLVAARAAAELSIRQQQAGNISDLDLENEQAMFAQAKLELAQSEGIVLGERERLNVLMGLWGSQTTWKPAPSLRDLPATEIDLEGVESLAVSQRLDLAAARQSAEAAARAVGLARPEAIGEILAGAHREREPEGASSTGPAVEIPLPVFNRGKARRSRAESQLRQALDRHAALAVEIRAEVRSARDRVLLARSRVEYYRDVILPRRERIVAFSQQHYNFMLIDAFQVLLARQSEVTARGESIEALRDYWIARSDLERAAGGSLHRIAGGMSSAFPSERSGEAEQSSQNREEQGGGQQ